MDILVKQQLMRNLGQRNDVGFFTTEAVRRNVSIHHKQTHFTLGKHRPNFVVYKPSEAVRNLLEVSSRNRTATQTLKTNF